MSNPRVPIKFELYRGNEFLRVEIFDEPIIKIGKVASSHLRLDDESASRMHAMIEVTGPDEVHVIDLGSATGTFVNGEKSTKARLQNGDEIVIGETRIVVEIGADVGVNEDEATMAINRASTGIDFGAMAAEHADPTVPPPGADSVVPSVPAPPGRGAGSKATLMGMPSGQPGAPPGWVPPHPAGPGLAPPRSGSVPPAPPGARAGGFANPFAAPAGPPSPAWQAEPSPYSQYHEEQTEKLPDEDPDQYRYGLVANGPPVNPDEVETPDRALEVMVMWGENSVLLVEHLNPIRSFYIGEGTDEKGRPTADYLMASELIGSDRMPVVVDVGGAGAVVIPAGATGEISVGTERTTVADLLASGRAQPCSEMAGAFQFPLPAGATARIQHRGLTFVVRPVNAGKPVGMIGSGVAWKEYAWTLLSFALHAVFLLSMYFMPPGGSALSLDLLNEDSRLAKYLMEPPETIEEETPDWLQNSDADDSEGGKGKRHKDDEGQMGKEEAKKTKNKYGIQGPADNEDPHMAREAAKEEATTAGILGVLAQSTGAWNSPTSPYGQDTALGYDPMSALGALMGDQIGENFGFGGLGLRGTGRGGGGTGEGTIGLGNVGTIGHGGGGGEGSGYGRGAGGFRGRDAKVPRIRSGNADVRGSLSKEVIRRVIQRHINEVRFCYEQELNQRPDIAGRVQVKFIIAPSGAVQAANVEDTTLGAARAEQCIAQAVRRWTFPAPDGGGIVVVSYPFVLEAAGG